MNSGELMRWSNRIASVPVAVQISCSSDVWKDKSEGATFSEDGLGV